MKHSYRLFMLSLLASAATAATAEPVQLYGVLEYSVGYFGTKVDGQSADNVVSLDSGRWMGNRWGIKGSEDLGHGMRVSFVLESGFDGDTGAAGQGGLLFGRESQLSLHTPVGTFAFGRMGNLASGNGTYSMVGKEATPFVAAMGMAGHFNYLFGNERYDNMITYQSPDFAGFRLSAQYSLQTKGTEEAHFADNNRYAGVGINWKNSTSYFAAIGEQYWYSNSATPKQRNASTVTVLGNHAFGPLKLYGVAQYMRGVPYLGMPNAVNPEGRIGKGGTGVSEDGLTGYSGAVSAAYNIWGGIAKISLIHFNVKDKGFDPHVTYKRYTVGTGYQYPLSKQTGVYVQANYSKTDREGTIGGKRLRDVSHYQVFSGIYHRF